MFELYLFGLLIYVVTVVKDAISMGANEAMLLLVAEEKDNRKYSGLRTIATMLLYPVSIPYSIYRNVPKFLKHMEKHPNVFKD